MFRIWAWVQCECVWEFTLVHYFFFHFLSCFYKLNAVIACLDILKPLKHFFVFSFNKISLARLIPETTFKKVSKLLLGSAHKLRHSLTVDLFHFRKKFSVMGFNLKQPFFCKLNHVCLIDHDWFRFISLYDWLVRHLVFNSDPMPLQLLFVVNRIKMRVAATLDCSKHLYQKF